MARVEERVFVEPANGQGRNIVPDVRVVERGRSTEPRMSAGNGIAVAEPLVVHLEQDEPVRQGFIEIIDIKSGRRVVTVIEVLSPSNKVSGRGRDLYLKKQEELRAGGVSLVEIDLLRAGTRVLSVPFDRIPVGHRSAYAACVRRGWKAFEVEYYRDPTSRATAGDRDPIAPGGRRHPPRSSGRDRPVLRGRLLRRRHRLPRGARSHAAGRGRPVGRWLAPRARSTEVRDVPAKDFFHDCVMRALIRDGWTITHDPLRLSWGSKDLYVDLGAERLLAAEKAGQRIAVEIKSFLGDSDVDDLEKAIGQYILYRAILIQREPERVLFLAVPDVVIRGVFEEPLGELLLKDQSIRLLGFDPETEVITRWIP